MCCLCKKNDLACTHMNYINYHENLDNKELDFDLGDEDCCMSKHCHDIIYMATSIYHF